MHRTRYGEANPERLEDALWEQAVRNNWAAHRTHEHLDWPSDPKARMPDPSRSSYRNATPGPFWSWQRFGRTSTRLDDGRVVHVGGEHEDFYDSNFCIYNDVVVEHPDGRLEFYLYPLSVFPPTDFHSATLVEDAIILIGALGYKDMRQPGTTQVLTLDVRTFKIGRLDIKGDGPGWISRHSAELRPDSVIVVSGGRICTKQGSVEPNSHAFQLDMQQRVWT
jgi:hypothetical protein